MITKNYKRRVISVLVTAIALPLIFSCTTTVSNEIIILDRDGNRTTMKNQDKDSVVERAITVSEILDEDLIALAESEDGGSAGFEIRTFNQEETYFFGNLHLPSLDEPLMAFVQNASRSFRTFSFSLLLNLEPVSFSVGEEDAFYDAFVFSLEQLEEVNIPLYLNPNAFDGVGSYALTAIVYALDADEVPESFAIEEHSSLTYHADHFPRVMALQFDLTYGHEADIVLSHTFAALDGQLSNSNLHGLSVLPLLDFNPTSDLFLQIDGISQELAQPDGSFVVQANPGEEMTLTFFANPFVMEGDHLETYGIIALLAGQQLEINEQSYLLVNSGHRTVDIVDYGTFTISVPDLPGRYTFLSLIIVNPHHLRSIDNFFPLDTSIPFVIEVVE